MSYNVWSIRGTGNYCAGIVIVAAETEAEAVTLAGSVVSSVGVYYDGEVSRLPLTSAVSGIIESEEWAE